MIRFLLQTQVLNLLYSSQKFYTKLTRSATLLQVQQNQTIQNSRMIWYPSQEGISSNFHMECIHIIS